MTCRLLEDEGNKNLGNEMEVLDCFGMTFERKIGGGHGSRRSDKQEGKGWIDADVIDYAYLIGTRWNTLPIRSTRWNIQSCAEKLP